MSDEAPARDTHQTDDPPRVPPPDPPPGERLPRPVDGDRREGCDVAGPGREDEPGDQPHE